MTSPRLASDARLLGSDADAALGIRESREALNTGDVAAGVRENLSVNPNVVELGDVVALDRGSLTYDGEPILSFAALPAFLRITDGDPVRRVQQCVALVQYYLGRACQCLVSRAYDGGGSCGAVLDRQIDEDLGHALQPSAEGADGLAAFANQMHGSSVETMSFSVEDDGGESKLVCTVADTNGLRLCLRLDVYDDRYWRIIAAVFQFWSVGFGMQEASRHSRHSRHSRGSGASASSPRVSRSPETAEIGTDALYFLLLGFVREPKVDEAPVIEPPVQLAIASIMTAIARNLPVASFLPAAGSILSIASALPKALPPLHLAVATVLASSPPIPGAVASVLQSLPRTGAVASVLPSAPRPGTISTVLPGLPPPPGVVASILASAPVSLEVAIVLPKDKTVVEAVASLIPPTKPYVLTYFDSQTDYYDLNGFVEMKISEEKKKKPSSGALTIMMYEANATIKIPLDSELLPKLKTTGSTIFVFKLRLGPFIGSEQPSFVRLDAYHWDPTNATQNIPDAINWGNTGNMPPIFKIWASNVNGVTPPDDTVTVIKSMTYTPVKINPSKAFNDRVALGHPGARMTDAYKSQLFNIIKHMTAGSTAPRAPAPRAPAPPSKTGKTPAASRRLR